jgi:hypothetical protein
MEKQNPPPEQPTGAPAPVPRTLSAWQIGVLGAAMIPMLVFGAIGAVGTYTNIGKHFPDKETALGVVAAGEGATLILALVMVGLTLLGQSSPKMVRLGLWLLPAVAAGTGAIVATTETEMVVNAITPLAMTASAEGMGLLARRIVVYTTGVDIEAQRRNAETMQRLSVMRAVANGHPEEKAREKADKKSWKLVKKVGIGDDELGATLVTVQRTRMTQSADTALGDMFAPAVTPALPAGPGSVTPALPAGTGALDAVTPGATAPSLPGAAVVPGTQGVTAAVTQVSPDGARTPSHPAVGGSRDAVADRDGSGVTDAVTDGRSGTGPVTQGVTGEVTVTLEEVAAVAGVPVPVTGERLTDPQMTVVLRHLRYRKDPPLSYRQAVAAFRDEGFVGGEERIRRTWGELMSQEETDGSEEPEETDSSHSDDGTNPDEEDEEEAGFRP